MSTDLSINQIDKNNKIETNKYPFVLFFRLSKYLYIDDFLYENKDKLKCSIFFIANYKDLNKLFNPNYQILVTYGTSELEYIPLVNSVIANRMRLRWFHLTEITSIEKFNYSVNCCFIDNCLKSRITVRPVFSLFTTTYNSYEKILRCYQSNKNQLLLDWEWVILDDSPDDRHFHYLRELVKDDHRVRLYRRSENSGNIGNVKNEAVSLCRGKYVLELDHDDELINNTLSTSAKYFDEHEDVGFIYMDFINIYENGANFWYGDFTAKGYGGYYMQKFNNKWVYVYITPNINNITLSYLTCCPNHPRIWRKDILMECGNYCEFLPICDDYEILLRTALNTKMVKIPQIGYIQYMNEGNNNFSLIRNSEIIRIGHYTMSQIYYNHFKINKKMEELNAHEDEKYIFDCSPIWKRDPNVYQYKYCNIIANLDYEIQYCFIGMDTLISNLDIVNELYKDSKNDFILLDNNCKHEDLCLKLDSLHLSNFKAYSLENSDEKELINYFLTMYKSTEKYCIVTSKEKNYHGI